MKALVLAAGRGKRMGDSGNKCLLEVFGRPLIEYSLDCASTLDISEILVVVGYKSDDIARKYGNSYHQQSLTYVYQREQNGIVDALECSKEYLGGEDFLLMLGDEVLVDSKHSEMIKFYYKKSPFVLCGIVAAENRDLIRKTYSVIQKNGRISRLIEKPNLIVNNFMGTGNCILNNGILSYIDRTPVNKLRGEKELADLIQVAIDDDRIVRAFLIGKQYFNINFFEDLESANKIIGVRNV